MDSVSSQLPKKKKFSLQLQLMLELIRKDNKK